MDISKITPSSPDFGKEIKPLGAFQGAVSSASDLFKELASFAQSSVGPGSSAFFSNSGQMVSAALNGFLQAYGPDLNSSQIQSITTAIAATKAASTDQGVLNDLQGIANDPSFSSVSLYHQGVGATEQFNDIFSKCSGNTSAQSLIAAMSANVPQSNQDAMTTPNSQGLSIMQVLLPVTPQQYAEIYTMLDQNSLTFLQGVMTDLQGKQSVGNYFESSQFQTLLTGYFNLPSGGLTDPVSTDTISDLTQKVDDLGNMLNPLQKLFDSSGGTFPDYGSQIGQLAQDLKYYDGVHTVASQINTDIANFIAAFASKS